MRMVLGASIVSLACLLCLPLPAVAAPCLDAVVGNPGAPPFIQIIAVPQPNGASGTVTGTAGNLRTGAVRVSVWAHTDRYYAQPFLNAPFTCVGTNGLWSSFTHGGKRAIALLVDDSYVLPDGSSIDYHPSTDPGVLAWTELPSSATLSFAGDAWWVKDSAPYATGPGPCVFSPGPQNVFVDDEGRLHLRIVRQGGTWTCAEVVLDRARGRGVYSFQVLSALDKLDARDVFAGFLFESLSRELDIECSWALTGLASGCQYVVQPFSTPGNRKIFTIPAGPSSHRIDWAENHVWFLSWRGLGAFPPPPQDVVQSFLYTGPNIPPPGRERMRFNLWLTASSPSSGVGSEVVIQSFKHCQPLGDSFGAPTLKVTASPSTVRRGARLAVGVTAHNSAQAFPADFYLGAVVPSGTLCFLTGLSPLGGRCLPAGSGPQVFPPLAADVLVTNPLDIAQPELLAYTVGGGDPLGQYLFFGLLTPPGALAGGQVDECQFLLGSPASVTVNP